MLAELIADTRYTDLPEGIHGVTIFSRIGKPWILLSNTISNPTPGEAYGRLKFITAHECGHAILHNLLYRRYWQQRGGWSSADNPDCENCYCCYLNACSDYRWYEWQANTVAGNLLMPPEHLETVLSDKIVRSGMQSRIAGASPEEAAQLLKNAAIDVFQVSVATAEIGIERFFRTHRYSPEEGFIKH